MKKDTSDYVRACETRAIKKDDQHKENGTTVRVPVVDLHWQEIQLDFNTNLPIKR